MMMMFDGENEFEKHQKLTNLENLETGDGNLPRRCNANQIRNETFE